MALTSEIEIIPWNLPMNAPHVDLSAQSHRADLLAYLQGDREPVFGALKLKLRHVSQHVLAHMCQDDPPALEPLPLSPECLVVQMVHDLLLEEVGFTDEQIGPARGLEN